MSLHFASPTNFQYPRGIIHCKVLFIQEKDLKLYKAAVITCCFISSVLDHCNGLLNMISTDNCLNRNKEVSRMFIYFYYVSLLGCNSHLLYVFFITLKDVLQIYQIQFWIYKKVMHGKRKS